MCDSFHGLLHHVFRISLLSFFMVIPGAFENTAMAETHIPSTGGRTFADGPFGGSATGPGPCTPISNTSNIANPSFNLPLNPVVPTPVQPTPPATQAAATKTSDDQLPGTSGGDAARGQAAHGGSCNSCHNADKYDIAAQIDAVEKGRMPKGKPLLDSEKADILAFLKTQPAK